jgi:hypothetical protein
MTSKANYAMIKQKHMRPKSERLEKINVQTADGEKENNNNEVVLYHGSNSVIERPDIGLGRINNDYGKGFYLTELEEPAGEWAVQHSRKDGYINKYRLNYCKLGVLDLNKYNVKAWISVLMQNRGGNFTREVELDMVRYTRANPIDIKDYDVIIGWRADDSYFRFIRSYVTGKLDLEELSEVIKLGNLGVQWCLKSEKAFKSLTFIGSKVASTKKYLESAQNRDRFGREAYDRLMLSKIDKERGNEARI